MRRLVVYLVVGVLATASVMPPSVAGAQEPALDEVQVVLPGNRDLTPYVIGLGAIMGVIAFNIAAPPVVNWVSWVARSFSNVATVTRVAGSRAMAGLVQAAPAAASAPPGAAVAAAARPIVPPLTQTMLAQAQIGGAAAAVAGAVVAHGLYRLVAGSPESPR